VRQHIDIQLENVVEFVKYNLAKELELLEQHQNVEKLLEENNKSKNYN
jgi:hypothetical protein